MQQKKTIIFTIALFLISSAYLFYASGKIMNPDKVKSWWTIYFSNPKSDSLNFVIENHSDTQEFSWKILKNNQAEKEGSEIISKGEKKEIEISENFEGKTIIEVTQENDKKEIYKNK